MDDKNFPYTSLCIVTEINDKGTGKLKRLVDLENGKLQSQFISSAPSYKFLYNNNCTLPLNFIGIFMWRVEPHYANDGRVYITCELCSDKSPIEIIILSNCIHQKDLRNKLVNGIKLYFSTDRIFIAYRVSSYIYRGILCSENDFKQTGDEKTIKAINLNLFEVSNQDFIRIEDKIFYRNLDLDKPIGVFHSKSLFEFIKDKIITRANRTTLQNNFSETDLKIFREFIKSFSADDFYQEIAEEYLISVEDSKNFVDKFIKTNEKYLETEIFNDDVFTSVIQNCSTLQEKFRTIVAKQWQTDNEQKISDFNQQLEKLHIEIDNELKNCLDLENEIEIKKKEFEEISNKIKQREDFASEVENNIAKRIEMARKNVADFICEMAFVNPNLEKVQTSKNLFYREGKIIGDNNVEIEDIQDLICTIETEIGIEGIQNENLSPFAAYLTASYINKISLLLAGANALDIADAFSICLTGKTAAIFDCATVNSFGDFDIIANSNDEIIALLNPFAPNFIAYLPELIHIEQKFIFAIYPFVEDLKIEPRSFYNYFLPVFTELIIDRTLTRNFFNRYSISDTLKKELEQRYNPNKIPISAEKRIKKLVKDMKNFLSEDKPATLFADFPLAYVKDNEKNFIDNFNGEEKILEKIREFLGDNE